MELYSVAVLLLGRHKPPLALLELPVPALACLAPKGLVRLGEASPPLDAPFALVGLFKFEFDDGYTCSYMDFKIPFLFFSSLFTGIKLLNNKINII